MDGHVKKNHNRHRGFKEIASRFTLITALLLMASTLVHCDSPSSSGAKGDQGLFTDDFDGDGLDSGWYWSNEPTSWDLGSTRSGWLTMVGNLDANLWCSDDASILYQVVESSADFDVSVRLYCEWGSNPSDVAGMIVRFPEDDNWINIKLWMHGDGSGRLEFQKKCDDIISPVPGSESSGGTRDVFLRIVKSGNDYTAYFKNNSGDDWIEIGATEGFGSLPIHVGIFGGVDQGSGDLLIQCDYLHK